MRIPTILWLAALTGAALVVGCGANEVDMGGGGLNPTPTPSATVTVTPTPTPSATPNPATFAPVQTFLEDPAKANCGQATCHVAGTTAPFILVTAPMTAQADVDANMLQLSCTPNIDDYTPTGSIITTFCTAAGAALAAPQHAGRTNLVDADCAALFTWLQSGTGTPVPCP